MRQPRREAGRNDRTSERGRAGVVALLALAAAGGLVWLLSRPTRSADEDPPPRIARSAAPQPAPGMQLPAVAIEAPRPADEAAPAEPDAEAVEAAPAGEPEVPHEWRDGNPHRQYVSPEYFEQKYAGATDEELLAAHEALGKELPHLMNAAAVAWMEAGGGESVVVPRPPPGEIEMGPGEKSYGLALTSRTRDAADGQLLKQSGLLPWEGNQSYYDRSDEQRWLGGELKRRGLPVPGYSSTLVKKQ